MSLAFSNMTIYQPIDSLSVIILTVSNVTNYQWCHKLSVILPKLSFITYYQYLYKYQVALINVAASQDGYLQNWASNSHLIQIQHKRIQQQKPTLGFGHAGLVMIKHCP